MPLDIHMFPCLNDNYGFLVRDRETGAVASIDTPEAARIIEALEGLGWPRLDYILNTHWHPDHTGGNGELKARYACEIYAPEEVRPKAPMDHVLKPGDVFMLGETRLDILDLGGHTPGQIGYHDGEGANLFVGDCLFSLGCGRLLGGTAEASWHSLKRLAALPPQTLIHCAHEYTLANLAFAESLPELASVAGADLITRAAHIRSLRAQDKPTIPMRLGDELKTNPFLTLPLREAGLEAQIHRFTALRAAKDVFTA
jgi:hydroxyacylglutathione hydrolase